MSEDGDLDNGFIVYTSDEGTTFVFDGMNVEEFHFEHPRLATEEKEETTAYTPWPSEELDETMAEYIDADDLEAVSELLSQVMDLKPSTTTTTTTSPSLGSTFNPQVLNLINRLHSAPSFRPMGRYGLMAPARVTYPFILQTRAVGASPNQPDSSYYVPVTDDMGIEELPPLRPKSPGTPPVVFVRCKVQSPQDIVLL
jgi:hypothetical protein